MKYPDYFSAIQDRENPDGTLLYKDDKFLVEKVNGQIQVTGIGEIKSPFIYASSLEEMSQYDTRKITRN